MIVDLADGSSMVCSKVEFCLDGYNVDNYRFFHIGEICRVKDVREVVRGKWLTKEYMFGDPDVGLEDYWVERLAEYGDDAYCSKCGKDAGLDGNEESALSAYCPNCGADMRQRRKHERVHRERSARKNNERNPFHDVDVLDRGRMQRNEHGTEHPR